MAPKKSSGKAPKKKSKKAEPFIEATYRGEIAKKGAAHTSGVPDWKTVFNGKHFASCANPPVHLLTIDLGLVPEFPENVRKLGKMPIVGNACDCDEADDYIYAIGKDGRLASLDDDDTTAECEPGSYRKSKKATPINLVPEAAPRAGKDCGVVVGGQPRFAQAPFWPPCTKCKTKKFFIATLYQYYLPPSSPGAGNTLNVFVCPKCRTQSIVRQST